MMRRYRKGETFRPPTAAESAAQADATESHRRSPAQPQTLAPVGQVIIVKTPTDGIDARDDTTISSAVCTRCIEIDGTSNTKTLVDTGEELTVYNIHASDVAGDSYVETALSFCGTRHVVDAATCHTGKLNNTLLYSDNTGVTVTIWTGKPAVETTRTIDYVVISELLMTSGQLNAATAVRIKHFDGRWQVVGAPCA